MLGNGKPLTAGRVSFIPKNEVTIPPASGVIRDDGSFALTTRKPDDGATPGEYRVRIEPAEVKGNRTSPRLPFPVKYIDEDSSGLVATVRAQANQLDPIQLK
jgi:hypothetical protein